MKFRAFSQRSDSFLEPSPCKPLYGLLFSSRVRCGVFAFLTVFTTPNISYATSIRVDIDNHTETITADNNNAGNHRLAAAVPDPPTSLAATANGTDTINLLWVAPSNNGGNPITGYKIEVFSRYGRVPSPLYEVLIENTGDTTPSYSHTGLAPNTTLLYRVSAINADGASTPSNEDDATTALAGSGTIPEVETVTVNDTEIEITFDETLDNNSVPSPVQFAIDITGRRAPRAQSVEITGAKVTVTLEEKDAMNSADALRVLYYPPTKREGPDEYVILPVSSYALKNSDGNLVENTRWKAATNNTPPRVTLVLDTASIDENGGISTMTATMPSAPTTAITVTVTAEPVAPAVDADFSLSGTTLTIAQGATTSTETVTITAVNNEAAEGNKTVTVSGTVSDRTVAAKPSAVTLTIIDDDEAPPPPSTPSTPSTPLELILDPPLYLRSTPGNEQVTLTWDPPFYDTGDITGYAYRYKQSDQYFGFDAPATWNDIPGGANARNYTVTDLTNGLEYTFEVCAENMYGGGRAARVIVALPAAVSTENEELPTEVALMGNYPNPFNPETTIGYVLPQASEVHLVVYDLLGHEIAVLVDGLQPAGRHTVRFGANDLPSGSYVYRLRAGDKIVVRTMMLVK